MSYKATENREQHLETINCLQLRCTTANRDVVENYKIELQNLKLQKTEAKKGQNHKTTNPNAPLVKSITFSLIFSIFQILGIT